MVDCTAIYNCADCITHAGCGWCTPANCVAGTTLGPVSGSCSSYKYKSCTLSNGMIGAMIAIFVCFGILVIGLVILVCCCKCKRGEKPVSTRDFDIQELDSIPAKESAKPTAKPTANDARRKALEEKYGRTFGSR